MLHLDRVRRSWAPLVQRIVQATLAHFGPRIGEAIVEIGSGSGQLREWLPNHISASLIHTEPSEPYLELLRQRFPTAQTCVASATSLPFESGSVGGVLALCVLDTVDDLGSVRDELRRVLRPGGVLLHYLDLSTSPYALFPDLLARDQLPLTNFASDQGLVEVLTEQQKAILPPAEPFDDVLAVDGVLFSRFVAMLRELRHPIMADLGPYQQLHPKRSLDPERLAHEFMRWSASPDQLRRLNRALLGVTLLGQQLGWRWPSESLSSRSAFREKLLTAFSEQHGFQIELASPVIASQMEAAREEQSFQERYFTRHAGRTVTRTDPPTVPSAVPVESFEDLPISKGHVPRPGERFRTTTVEVFVARRQIE